MVKATCEQENKYNDSVSQYQLAKQEWEETLKERLKDVAIDTTISV